MRNNVLILVNVMHITASVFINDDERGLHADYDDWLEACVASYAVAPHEPVNKYRHNRTGEACPERSRRDNGDAHLKRQIMGRDAKRSWR